MWAGSRTPPSGVNLDEAEPCCGSCVTTEAWRTICSTTSPMTISSTSRNCSDCRIGFLRCAGLARLTPLSQYAMRLQMIDNGVDVPLLPPDEDMTVADLVEFGKDADDEEMAVESEGIADQLSEAAFKVPPRDTCG